MHICDADIAIAACRAKEIGILDFGFGDGNSDRSTALKRLRQYAHPNGQWGIRWDMYFQKERTPAVLEQYISEKIPLLILSGLGTTSNDRDLKHYLKISRRFADRIFHECTSVDEAQFSEAAGFDGIILKGNEAGGFTGSRSAFILLQQAHGIIKIPYWIQGGMGEHTSGAAMLAGATGVVLSEQLWLAQESPLAAENRKLLISLNGGETSCLGKDEVYFRFICPQARAKYRELEEIIIKQENWYSHFAELVMNQGSSREELIPCGQDIGLAAGLADRFGTVGNILGAIRESAYEHIKLSGSQQALSTDGPMAKLHGTRYPFVQGPMANISHTVPFCQAVAKAGALPFVALSALPGEKVREVLDQAQKDLKSFSWGVGVLGFLPRALLDEQFSIIQEAKPPFAIIAGGRSGQAKKYESAGIRTYLHAPSPGLLQSFYNDGVRRFIFEGRECGGHVGPLTSFMLWESVVRRLLDVDPMVDLSDLCLLFAGGIHDELSASMVQVITAKLIERGANIGILMGTAYLFSDEAVQSGAITPTYQDEIIKSKTNVLLHSGSGHASCCVKTPFIEKFYEEKQKLISSDISDAQILQRLESLNLGRLLLAAKGVAGRFEKSKAQDHVKHTLVSMQNVDDETQHSEGLFMAGQVSQFYEETFKMADLHARIAENYTTVLQPSVPSTVSVREDPANHDDVAIIGIASIFPDADNFEQYWHNILQRHCAIREIPSSRWNIADFYDPDRKSLDKSFSKWGGFLSDVPFDPVHYSMAPKVLESTDAVQLMALEITRRALQDSGYLQKRFRRDRTAVIFGAEGMNDLGVEYAVRAMAGNLSSLAKGLSVDLQEQMLGTLNEALPQWTSDSFPGILTNLISGRVANRFDLGGTNYTCQAACATSHAAIEISLNQLRNHACDMCLVGAVDLGNNPFGYIMFSRSQVLSPTGRSLPLDNTANGIVLSEGAACLVLKRLTDAEKDGDHIYAVIKGIGSASDGRRRSLVAPDQDGQVRAINAAYRSSRVDPKTVQMLELHGTGTVLGDKVEIDSTKRVFCDDNGDRLPCAIGSVKSNIGHTKVAAGMAGIIKAAMSLKHKLLPPTIGVTVPNKQINFGHSTLYINTDVRPWIRTAQDPPRRAGVSSFGFGGTNFHVLLEEYEGEYRQNMGTDFMPRNVELFIFADDDPATVVTRVLRLREQIKSIDVSNLAQLAYSVFNDSKRYIDRPNSSRLILVVSDIIELTAKIDEFLQHRSGEKPHIDPQGIYFHPGTETVKVGEGRGRVCLLFPGQGSQKVNMLRDLVFAAPSAHETIAMGDEITASCFKKRLSDYIFPPPIFSDADKQVQQKDLSFSHITQPALAVADLIAFDVLAHYGLHPDYMAGHSFGEYVALCAAGSMSRDELLRLAEARGRIVSENSNGDRGAMAAVTANGDTTAGIIRSSHLKVYIANYNSPDQTVISGSRSDIEKSLTVFKNKRITARLIAVSAAFHSPLMETAGEKLGTLLRDTRFKSPNFPVFSNTTAERYPHAPDRIRDLLTKHIHQPVRFEDQIRRLYDEGVRIFIETGPGKVLSNLVDRILTDQPHHTFWIDKPGRNGWRQLAHLLAHVHILGWNVDLSKWFAGRPLHVQGTEAYVLQEEKAQHPGRNVWRIFGGRAAPWHQSSADPYNEKLSFDNQKPNRKDKPDSARHMPSPEVVKNNLPLNDQPDFREKEKETMNKNVEYNQFPTTTGAQDQSTSTIDQSNYFNMCQNALGQFMEMQQQQQKTAQSFISIQDKMLGVAFNGHHMTEPISMPVKDVSKTAYVDNEEAVSLEIPPAPSIPTLKFEPPQKTVQPYHNPENNAAQEAVTAAPHSSPMANHQVTPVVQPPLSIAVSTKEEFQAALIQIASDSTGFDPEMLSLNSNMETDLGIDSIKKVEIFSLLRERFDMMNQLDEDLLIEEVAELTTLGSVVEWFQGKLEQSTAAGISQAPDMSTQPLSHSDSSF